MLLEYVGKLEQHEKNQKAEELKRLRRFNDQQFELRESILQQEPLQKYMHPG